MKKIFILLSLAFAVFFGCVQPELETPETEATEYNTVLTVTLPGTKVAIDDAYTKLTWSNGDKISVLTSSGAYRKFVYDGNDGATSAEFKGTLLAEETIADWAIYPAHADHSVDASGRPQVYLPTTYDWEETEVMGPMVAEITEDGAAFAHAGGLFAFDVKNVPAGTDAFRFYTSKVSMSGSTAYQTDKTLKVSENTNGSYIDMNFTALREATDMKFYIPAPTGSYEDFTIYFHNENYAGADDNGFVEIKSSAKTNVIEAATVKVFSVTIEGGAWYVTESGSAEADGLSWTTATTLSSALSKADDGDVIYVGAGTYIPDTFISGYAVDADGNVADAETDATSEAQKAFIVDKNVSILGGYPAAGGNLCNPETNKTILSGNNVTNHVVVVVASKVAGKSVKMSGFTVTGAASAESGKTGWKINGNTIENQNGAFCVSGANLVLSDMIFTGNKSVNASAIYGVNSVVDIKDCMFTGNTASANGTVWFTDGSELTFSDSEISGNTANNAAGLYLYLSSGATMTANVSNVTITGNTSSARGAVYLRTATAGQSLNAVIDGCSISENSAKEGAAITLLNAFDVTIKNTIVNSNTGGTSLGGVISSIDANAKYENCSFESNTSKNNGVFLVQTKTIATINRFNKCTWYNNSNTKAGILFTYSAADFKNSVVITNSLFNNNKTENTDSHKASSTLTAYGTKTTNIDVKCVNTTFYNNIGNYQGTAVNAYGSETATINIDLISCTITANKYYTEANYYAVYASTAGAQINLYNSLIVNNIGKSNNRYNVGKIDVAPAVVREYCQNGTTYYNSEGKSTANNGFAYTTMLGALNADGVCPLLLPDTNPAVTGGMSATELEALASENVPASILKTDQLGNERTGNVIGAYSVTSK